MTLRKIAGLGALLSLPNPGQHLAQKTTLDSGAASRRRKAISLLPFVAIPSLASFLCTSAHKQTFADGAANGGRMHLQGFRLGDALISLIRAGIPIRGST